LKSEEPISSPQEKEIKPSKGRQKKTTIEDRLSIYQKEFNWLYSKDNHYFCTYCQKLCEPQGILAFEHARDSIFIFSGSDQLKKDAYNKHRIRELHCQAALKFGNESERLEAQIELMAGGKQNLKKMFQVSLLKEGEVLLLPIFRSIYFSAKSDMSLIDCEKLCDFLNYQNVSIQNKYRSYNTLKEMLYSISASIQGEHLKELS